LDHVRSVGARGAGRLARSAPDARRGARGRQPRTGERTDPGPLHEDDGLRRVRGGGHDGVPRSEVGHGDSDGRVVDAHGGNGLGDAAGGGRDPRDGGAVKALKRVVDVLSPAGVLALLVLAIACAGVLLTAPPGSALTIIANPGFVAADGGVSLITIIATE